MRAASPKFGLTAEVSPFAANKTFWKMLVVETYPLCSRSLFGILQADMFLRSNTRIRDGEEHRYYAVVESRPLQSGKATQRQVLYLGEINDSQQAGSMAQNPGGV
jgi:hypothetical protein